MHADLVFAHPVISIPHDHLVLSSLSGGFVTQWAYSTRDFSRLGTVFQYLVRWDAKGLKSLILSVEGLGV